MEKLLSLALTLTLILSLAACGNNPQAPSSTPLAEPSVQSSAQGEQTDTFAINVEDGVFSSTPQDFLDYLNECVLIESNSMLYSLGAYPGNREELKVASTSLTLTINESANGNMQGIELYWFSGDNNERVITSAGFYSSLLLNALIPENANSFSENMTRIISSGISDDAKYSTDLVDAAFYTFGSGGNKLEIFALGAPAPEATADQRGQRGILGSHYTDIVMSCKDFGLEDHKGTTSSDETKPYFDSSISAFADNAGVDTSFDYSLTVDADKQIVSSSFGATWLAAGDNALFLDAAKLYLGFVSTMPYDAADATTARAWVEDNIPAVADGDGLSTTIGDATYKLFGTKTGSNYTAFLLSISKTIAE